MADIQTPSCAGRAACACELTSVRGGLVDPPLVVVIADPLQGPPPRVFISYAHASEDHVAAVRSLWILLRTLGIDAQLDRLAAQRRQDWPVWMMKQVREADFILVVASEDYCKRAEGRARDDEGRGVQAEAALIRDAVYAAPTGSLNRFLPVLLPGEALTGIPAFLGPNTTTHYRIEPIDKTGIEQLLRVLTDQPEEVQPQIGTVPHLPPRAHEAAVRQAALFHQITLDVTCSDRRVTCRMELGGTLLGEHEAALPAGLETIWDAQKRPPSAAGPELETAGQRLREALFDDTTLDCLAELLVRSPLGTVVDFEFRGDEAALGLPYELLRLPDGRLLSTLPGARFRRRVPGVNRAVVPALPGPLKILVAVGAPEETLTENAPLDIEAEMQAILDAIGGVEGAGRAQIRILEVGGPKEIEDALVEDQYHILHISAHGSASSLELEDEDGAPVTVDAPQLVERLRASGRPLPLVVLSSCAGAAHGACSLAARLIEHGVDRVLAMQASVTDVYATLLARQFYDALGAPRRTTASGALAVARRALEVERVSAAQSGGPSGPPEYAVATLLTADDDLPLVDVAAQADPLRHATQAPAGGAVRSLRIGELIGRRKQLREALRALRGGSAATERFGDVSGVVLTGVGGIGKTALAGRIECRLAEAGWLTAVHEGSWDPSKLTKAVVEALGATDRPHLMKIRDGLKGTDLNEETKVDIVCQLLAQMPLLLFFDDFERNLDSETGQFSDPGFAEIFERLCDAACTGRLLVTSRHPIAGSDQWMCRIRVPALSPAELRRLLIRLPALRSLDADDRNVVMRTIGGHPRLIEFVDAMLRGGRGNLREVTKKLRTLAETQDVDLSEPATLERTLSDAILLGSRDIVLRELLSHLEPEERELALQAAVSTMSMSMTDLAFARYGDGASREQLAAVRRAVNRLCDLTLLSPVGENGVVVHPWIADALAAHQGDDLDRRHRAALAMRLAHERTGEIEFGELVEICRHLSATSQFDHLVAAVTEFCETIASRFGELSVASFLGEVLALVPTNSNGYLPLAHRERAALERSGSLGAAASRAAAVLASTQRRAEASPTNPKALREVAVAHNAVGNIAVQTGDTAIATTHYAASFAIAQRLANKDPGDATAQRDLSISHDNVGDLALHTGDGATAARHYQAALQIRLRLADQNPDNATLQRDLSVSHYRVGDLARRIGEVDTAATHYEAALEITQGLADQDPDSATAQLDLGSSHDRLGDLALRAGDIAGTATHYQAALVISHRLAQQDPTNVTTQRNLSVSHERLGHLALQLGDNSSAATHLQAALTINQHLADQDPTNATAQRDLSISHTKLGDLARQTGDRPTAIAHYQAQLEIAQRLAVQDPRNAIVQRDLSISHLKLGDLLLNAGDTEAAAMHFQAALPIRQRLADQDPGNPVAQLDLGISHNRLGDVFAHGGAREAAAEQYRAALAILEAVGEDDARAVETREKLVRLSVDSR